MDTAGSYVDSRKRYAEQLLNAAESYYWMAIAQLPDDEEFPGTPQALVGNLTVAAELFIKSYLAAQTPLLVLDHPGPRLVAYCACPDALPSSFRSNGVALGLLTGGNRTRGYADCLSSLYDFVPSLKSELDFALKKFPEYRDAAVHSATRDSMSYLLSRVAWATIRLRQRLLATQFLGTSSDAADLSDAELEVERNYERDFVARLDQKTKTAEKTFAAHVGDPVPVVNWEPLREARWKCPICNSQALLRGRVTADYEEALEAVPGTLLSSPSPILGEFHTEGLRCPTCRLELETSKETAAFQLPGIIDVSDDLAAWWAARGDAATEELLRGDWWEDEFLDDTPYES